MIIQKVVKGISNIDEPTVQTILADGIYSNWWRAQGTITNPEIKRWLTEANVIHHLNDYARPLPASHPYSSKGITYGDITPFISTSAGAVQRFPRLAINIPTSAIFTAVDFATKGFTTEGWVFHLYLHTIGKKAIPFQYLGEEVRELNIYRSFLPYYHEGEIVAKVHIPSIQIEKAEKYDGLAARKEWANGRRMFPIDTILNPDYAKPDDYSNIRDWF